MSSMVQAPVLPRLAPGGRSAGAVASDTDRPDTDAPNATVAVRPEPAARLDPSRGDADGDHPDDTIIRDVEAQLAAMYAHGRDAMKRAAQRIDPMLQPAGYWLLHLLHKRGPARSSVLAEYLQIDRSTVSRLLQGMEDVGLVEGRPDPDDGRARVMALTPEAERRLHDVSHANWLQLRGVFASWEPREVEQLAQLLARFNEDRTLQL